MNKQIAKIDELIGWFDANEAPENISVVFLAMVDANVDDTEAKDNDTRQVTIKSMMEGFDDEICGLLVNKMIDLPVLRQVFDEALKTLDSTPNYVDFVKWREKKKYDNPYEPMTLPTVDELKPIEGEPVEHIKKLQEFCEWISAKQSRNMTMLLLAKDELNSAKTTMAMGYAPEIVTMLAKEMQENYNFLQVVIASMFALDQNASFEEYSEWKEYSKKK